MAATALKASSMSQRTVVNLILLGAVAALAALAYLLPASKPAHAPVPLTALTPERVTRVQISRVGGPTVVMTRHGGYWRIVKPVRAPANRFIIHSLLGVTRTDSHGRFPVKGRDLGEFGLKNPSLRVQLNDVNIAFGNSEPLNGRRFVLIGSMIHVISNLYYQEASGGVADFVSRSLLPEDSVPVKLALPDTILERKEGEHWVFAGGGREGPAQGAEELVDQWRRAQALEVKPYSGSLDHPAVHVTLDKGGPVLEFRIVRTDPELILARPDIGMAYHFTASQAKKLLHLPAGGDKGDAAPGAPAGRPHA